MMTVCKKKAASVPGLTCIPGGLPLPPPEYLASKGLANAAARMVIPSTRDVVKTSLHKMPNRAGDSMHVYALVLTYWTSCGFLLSSMYGCFFRLPVLAQVA